MAQFNAFLNDDLDHIIITPCYKIYDSNINTSSHMLRCLYEEYLENYNTGVENETCIQGWQGLMAIVRLLRERGEWDKKNCKPTEHTMNTAPLWMKLLLKPGTDEWKAHWVLHPEEQCSMSKHAYRQRKKEGK